MADFILLGVGSLGHIDFCGGLSAQSAALVGLADVGNLCAVDFAKHLRLGMPGCIERHLWLIIAILVCLLWLMRLNCKM